MLTNKTPIVYDVYKLLLDDANNGKKKTGLLMYVTYYLIVVSIIYGINNQKYILLDFLM